LYAKAFLSNISERRESEKTNNRITQSSPLLKQDRGRFQEREISRESSREREVKRGRKRKLRTNVGGVLWILGQTKFDKLFEELHETRQLSEMLLGWSLETLFETRQF